MEWQPIETAPRDIKVAFWLVPKASDETYTNSSGEPILARGSPYRAFCKYNCWPSLWKATHWQWPIQYAPPPEA